MVYWVYTKVETNSYIIRMVAQTHQHMGKSKANQLQRLACLGITGAMRTTPTAALKYF